MITIEYIRSFRLGPFAIFDFAVSYLGVYILVPMLNKIISPFNRSLTHFQWILLVLPLSILFHIIFRNFTPLTKQVIDPSGHYLIKVILLLMLYFGLRR